MNRTEHILTVLGEEGGEVAKEACKALRFGLDDQLTRNPHGPRGTEGPTVRDKIAGEFVDLLGAYQMGVLEGILPDLGLDRLPVEIRSRMNDKIRKVTAFMGYAVRVGALEDYSASLDSHPTDLPLSARMNLDGTVDPQPSEILPFTSTDGPRF